MKDWLSKLDPKWVATNVVGWGFLAVVMYSVFVYMILPTQAHSFRVIDRVADAQVELAKAQADLAATQKQQTPTIDRIDRNTSK